MFQMQMVGSTQVHGFNSGVGGGFLVGAKGPVALKHIAVSPGPEQVTAGKEEVYLLPQRLNAFSKGLGKLSAANYA
jgi:hypothetical protein